MPPIRVLIVSENISMWMGGESSLPYFYAKLLHLRGAEVWLAFVTLTTSTALAPSQIWLAFAAVIRPFSRSVFTAPTDSRVAS